MQDLELGAVVQAGMAKQDTTDWNQFCQDTSSPSFLPSLTDGGGGSGGGAASGLNRRVSMVTMHAPPARGDALAALAGALRTGFKSLERLDLRGCFLGVRAAAHLACAAPTGSAGHVFHFPPKHKHCCGAFGGVGGEGGGAACCVQAGEQAAAFDCTV